MRRRMASIVLALTLLLAAGAMAETTLMVATDLHYIDPTYFEGSDLLTLSALFGDGKAPQHSAAWLEGLVREALAVSPDVLILSGDLSYNGEVLSHRAVSDALARVRAAGIRVLVMPGNHDLNNTNAFAYLPEGTEAVHSLTPERYGKYYAAYGIDGALSADEHSFSYARALRDDLWLVVLEAGVFEPYGEPFGFVEDGTEAWLEGVLARARDAGAQAITVTHQSILPHSERITYGTMILNWEDISALLARYGVRLNLSGHLHIQHIAQQDGLHDVALSSLAAWPNQYALVTIADDGAIDYRTRPLSADNLPEGIPQASHGFFLEVNETKIMMALRDIPATDAQKAEMAAYAAWMNMHFYGGTSTRVAGEAADAPALALWRDLAPDERWTTYLGEMLAAGRDMTVLSLPAPGESPGDR